MATGRSSPETASIFAVPATVLLRNPSQDLISLETSKARGSHAKKATRPEDGWLGFRLSGGLERDAHAEFELPWRTERVDARAVADPKRPLSRLSGSVHRLRIAVQEAGHDRRQQVEVGEVEQVVDAHARFDGEPFLDCVPPRQL